MILTRNPKYSRKNTLSAKSICNVVSVKKLLQVSTGLKTENKTLVVRNYLCKEVSVNLFALVLEIPIIILHWGLKSVAITLNYPALGGGNEPRTNQRAKKTNRFGCNCNIFFSKLYRSRNNKKN